MSEPRAYDFKQPGESERWFNEVKGYLLVCENCGTDFRGRAFARDAIRTLMLRVVALEEHWRINVAINEATRTERR